MRWWKLFSLLALAVALASGCGKSTSSGVTISVAPLTASVVTNQPQPFSATVTGSSNSTVTWTLTCATGVTAGTCGSITPTTTTSSTPTTQYTAPATLPTTTSNGTTTIAPTATITATSQADTSKSAGATITIITGISIIISPSSATVGTGEHFPFTATVNNPGCIVSSNSTCKNVTWSLPTKTSTFDPGTITVPDPNNPNTAKYTAPGTVPSPSVVTITATSVADTSVTATAQTTIVTATTPTVNSVSPNATALGGLFQDIYISGANFISTNNVYINGAQLDPTGVSEVSSTVIRARIPDVLLAIPPASNILQVGVSEQVGAIQTCSDASQCQIAIRGVRPGVVGPSPNSISQQSSSGTVLTFNVDGGFFGTPANPAVTAAYDGQLRGVQVNPSGAAATSTRQMSVTIGGSANPNDLGQAGLHQVAVKSATDPAKFAATNLAVQTDYNTTSITPVAPNRIPVGSVPASSAPSDVAINPATGMAVVANTGSNDVSLIDLTSSAPAVVANICTLAVGLTPPCPTSPASTPSGPTSVSVDYFRNVALVANSASKTIAVVDLSARAVTSVIQLPPETPGASGNAGTPGTPGAVGINPVTGRALVAMQSKSYGVLLDLCPPTHPGCIGAPNPRVAGVVSISTGPNTRVAVEPHLNWAVTTPGGAGSIGVVDLNQQTSIPIATLSRTNNTVQVTVQTSGPPLTVHINSAVQISGASDNSFNGIYLVTQLGPASTQFSYSQTVGIGTLPDGTATGGTVNYSPPIPVPNLTSSVQGIGINTETQQAVMVDPSTNRVSFYSLLDQSSSSLSLQTNNTPEPGTIAAAFNPLTNTVVAVNFLTGMLSVIDPTTPRRLNDTNLYDLNTHTPCANGCGPVAVAVDPGTNTAVVVNQKDNSVSVLNLGPIRPFSITETIPKVVVTPSSLSALPAPSVQQLTVTGKGLTCVNGTTNLTVRLDGSPLQTLCSGNGDRQLTANALLSSAHRYALDVADTSGNVTNAEDFTVEQSIDVSSTLCPTPQPSGVAVDPLLGNAGTAAVSLFGCNTLALIDIATGTVRTVNVGSNPVGVAVLPRLQLAVVANSVSANASIINESTGAQTSQSPVATGTSPTGAAADEVTGEVAIANNGSNTISVVNAQTGAVHSITTGAGPVAVAFNYANHQVAVADFGSSSIGIADGSGSSTTAVLGTFNAPTSVVYDPVPGDCGSSASGSAPNTVGCFLANSSTDDQVFIIDPVAGVANSSFKVGINPTAIAYNFLTSTVVSTNTSSRTVTVADFLAHQIRAALPLPPIAPANSNFAANLGIAGVPFYALDVHPFLNLAVIADTANGAVLFIPLPR